MVHKIIKIYHAKPEDVVLSDDRPTNPLQEDNSTEWWMNRTSTIIGAVERRLD